MDTCKLEEIIPCAAAEPLKLNRTPAAGRLHAIYCAIERLQPNIINDIKN